MRSAWSWLILDALIASLAGASLDVWAASLAESERRGGQTSRAKAVSAQRLGGAGMDPLQRAVDEDRITSTHFRPSGPQALPQLSRPEGIDLDVTYIQMTPLYHAYCLDYSIDGLPRLCAGTENDKRWPDRGEPVTFTAHFMNKGTVASGSFQYAWAIDGGEVARGGFPNLQPGTGSVAVYVWPWGHDVVNGRLLGQHTVRFTLDPDNEIVETTKSNNALEDRTDATPLGFQITPEVYQALGTPSNPNLPFSAEDWVQKQFHAMNDAFARSVFPSAPNGGEERVRLDQFRITASQVANDSGIGGWFLSVDDRFNGSVDPATDIDGPMLHELAHQLGIIDIYHLQIDWLVPHRVLDNTGRPALMEQLASYRSGLMVDPGIQPPSFDESTVGGMNRNKGYRRGYFGDYLWDMPSRTQVLVLDNQGAPAPGVTLKLFRLAQSIEYDGANDNTPEMTVTSGADGIAELPNRYAGPAFTTATRHALAASPIGRIDLGGDDTFLVEIDKGAHQEYAWLDVTDLNLLAWRGGSTLELRSHVPPPDAPLPPQFLAGTEEGNSVVLHWGVSPTTGIRGYKVYRTSGPRDTWSEVTDVLPGLSGTFEVERNTIGFAVTAVGPAGRESGFSDVLWALRLQGPDGIAIGPDNQRFLRQWDSVILQGGDGRYLNVVRGAEPDHGHLALDPNGRLFMCRRDAGSVAAIDPGGDPSYNVLFELGGPGPGEIGRAAGVATIGERYTWGGPYAADSRTALLCHFDGSTASESGIVGHGVGVSFAVGRFGQGIVTEDPATLSYRVKDLFNGLQGGVEFWLSPNWRGDDQTGHILLDTSSQSGHGVRIEKDGADNLRAIVWNDGPECGVGVGVGGWRPKEWHHVGMTWEGTELSLFVDGQMVSRTPTCGLPRDLSGNVFIGSAGDGARPAKGVFDELRISNVARIGNSDTAGRILVADGGNDRLEVFNLLGDFVGSYGGSGSGNGQFRSPAGIATDGNASVVVVDAGNSRLQLFTFDGTAFTFLRAIDGGLKDPDGVAMRGDRIVVADTGHNQVKVFSAGGELVATYDGPNDGVYAGSFYQPRDVAVGNNGRIVVVDTGNNRVVEVIHSEPHTPRRRLHRGN